jgi:hypothetical protein
MTKVISLLQIKSAHGFLGMLCSIDCMPNERKYCHVAWKGQFSRCDHGKPAIMLEVVASQTLGFGMHIWNNGFYNNVIKSNYILSENNSDFQNLLLDTTFACILAYKLDRFSLHRHKSAIMLSDIQDHEILIRQFNFKHGV